MNRLFLAFSNSQQSPLQTLQEEDEQIFSMLSRREAENHFQLYRDASCTIPNIAKYLTRYLKDITLFHFSGHAGRDQLVLNDASANAAGIAQLLGRCPNLKLVVLNGCSTKGQVQALLQAGVPAVIATSAPVGDHTAKQFAITFFQAMADSYRSVEEAFQDAIGSAQTQSGQVLKVEMKRGGFALDDNDLKPEEPLWGLYYREESDLEWKLPLATYVSPVEYVPNEKLIEKLIEALAPYNEEIRKIKEDEDLGAERSAGEKKNAILTCLPHPVSQQLRKLMSKEMGREDYIFYDKAGPDRLWQIGHTYSTMIELLAFILLADLWQTLEKKADLQLQASDLSTLLAFFIRQPSEKKPFDFLPLIRSIRQIMERNELPFFMKEFPEVSKSVNEDTAFAAACRFLEALRQQIAGKSGLSETEAIRLCPTAEEKLATVFSQLGFLAAYSLSSVRNINVLKFRYPPEPVFNHKVIPLVLELSGLNEHSEYMDTFMDSASVLLKRKDGDKSTFLNLSPFVIDESSFDEKAELAKLFFFERYEKSLDAQRYRHVYKPGDLPLVVRDQKHFKVLRAQFDAFSRSLFHQTLKDL